VRTYSPFQRIDGENSEALDEENTRLVKAQAVPVLATVEVMEENISPDVPAMAGMGPATPIEGTEIVPLEIEAAEAAMAAGEAEATMAARGAEATMAAREAITVVDDQSGARHLVSTRCNRRGSSSICMLTALVFGMGCV